MNDFVAVVPHVNVNVSVDCCLPMFSKGIEKGGNVRERERRGRRVLSVCMCACAAMFTSVKECKTKEKVKQNEK